MTRRGTTNAATRFQTIPVATTWRRRPWFKSLCRLVALLVVVNSLEWALFSARSGAAAGSVPPVRLSVLAGLFGAPGAWATSALQPLLALVSGVSGSPASPAGQGGGSILYVGSGDCGGAEPCYPSIQSAIDAATAGQTVRVQAGTYQEQLRIKSKNAATADEASRIVIEADPGVAVGSVVLGGREGRCEAGYAVEFDRSRYVTLRGFTINGAGARGIGLRGGSRQNESITIERNRILGSGQRECSGGIDVGRGNTNTVILNNLIYGNGRNGIRFRDGRGGSYFVIGNTIARNAWSGIQIAHAAVVELINNVIVANGIDRGAAQARVGVRRLKTQPSPASDVRLRGNLVCGNRGGELSGSLLDATDSANLTPTGGEGPGVAASPACGDLDALFVDPDGLDGETNSSDDDFRLAAGSAAIDAGIDPRDLEFPLSVTGLEADFDGVNARPRDGDGDGGAAFDPGAHERPGASTPTPTPSPTPSPSPSPTPGPDFTPTPTLTPSPTPDPTPVPTPSPAPSPTPSPVPTVSPSPSPTPTPTPREHAPEIVSEAPTQAGTQYLYRYPVAAVDADAGDVLSFTLEAAPLWMGINNETGVIDGTPTVGDQGWHPVRVRVQDQTGLFDVQEFVVEVAVAANRPPIITSDPGAECQATVPHPRRIRVDGNLASLVAGAEPRASSWFDGSGPAGGVWPPLRAIDGNLGTSWFTAAGDAANLGSSPYLEVDLPATDVTVRELRLFGNREFSNGFHILAGRFVLIDANGVELFDSGEVQLPAPTRDVVVAVPDVSGVRRVRFVATADESAAPGFAELEILGSATVLAYDGAPMDLTGGEQVDYPETRGGAFDANVPASWHLLNGGASILEASNSNASIWLPLQASDVGWATGIFSTTEVRDDDYFGFVFGYQDPGNYYLFDWRQQVMSIKRVTAGLPLGIPDLWPTTGNPGRVEVLAQKPTAWVHGVQYRFDLRFVAGQISVTIMRGNEVVAELSTADPTFSTGRFGLYEYSQAQTTFSDIRVAGEPSCAGEDGSVLYVIDGHCSSKPALENCESESLVENGSFEIGPEPGGFLTLAAGSTVIQGWVVAQATIDYMGSQYSASDGARCIDVTGTPGAGGMAQTIATQPGERYRVVFDMAGNPFGDPGVREMEVRAAGKRATYSFDITGHTATNMGWVENTFEFIADSSSTKLEFLSLVDGRYGPSLDNVKVFTCTERYSYDADATDPDGDIVNFSLANAPAGMVIDPVTGAIAWPPVVGEHLVALEATDSRGGVAKQTFALVVTQDLDCDTITAEADCDDTNPSVYPGAPEIPGNGIDEDCDGQDTTSPLDIDDDGDGVTERQGDCDDTMPGIYPGAVDVPSNGIDENCDGRDATPPPASIVVRPSPVTLVTNQSQAFTAEATLADGSKVDVTSEVAWGSTPSGRISIDANGIGVTTAAGDVTVTASKDGVQGSAAVTILARVADDTPPTVAITSPEVPDAKVSAPIEIKGTADDTNFLRYELELAPENSDEFRIFAEGDSRVVGGVLGTLDPTMLPNGVYRVRLRAYDLGGNSNTAQTRVSVVGELKLGNFRLSFTDLTIPVAGLPIALTRTYDSLDTREGDFGAGWSLGYPGRIEDSASESPVQAFTDFTRVYVTKPDGRRIGFTFQATCGFFGCTPGFRPDPGVFDTLAVASSPGALFRSGDSYFAFAAAFNPRTYVLTTKERVKYTLDEIDGLTHIEDANGNTLDFTETAITSSTGVAVTLERDAAGRIRRVIEPDPGDGRAPGVLEYVYDARGNLVSFFDQLRNETKYSYGRSGFPNYLTKIEDPLGRPTARNYYDEEGRLVALCDFNGNATPPEYPGCTVFTPSPGTREQTIVNAKSHKTTLVLDGAGNVLVERRYLDDGVTALETRRTYDSQNNLLTETDPEGNVKLYSYDVRGNQLTSTEGGRTTTRTYNACNKVLSETDPGGNTTTTAYDATGCLARFVTNALGHTTEYRYDDPDARGQVSDFIGPNPIEANRVHWRWEYDSTGFLASMELVSDPAPGEQKATFQFSGAGDLLSQTDRKGQTITLAYDDAHRVRTETWDTLPPRVTTYGYNELGQLTSAVDPDSSLTIGYDNLGRVQSVDNAGTPGAPQVEITYGYDANGNVASVTDSLGGVTAYEYDALDRLRMITQFGTGVSEKRVDLKYDGANLLRTLRRFSDLNGAQGVANTFYDYNCGGCAGRLSQIHHRKASDNSVIHDLDFVRDSVGNITQMSDAEGLHTYTYDAIRQLLTATHPLGGAQPAEFYAYDSGGNRLTSHLSSSYAYEPGTNRLVQDDQYDYRYDANGSLERRTDRATGDITEFRYDHKNRLFQAVSRSAEGAQLHAAHYRHDSAGRRLGVSEDGRDVYFIYDGVNPILVHSGGTGAAIRRLYGRGVDRILAYQVEEETEWSLTDNVSSVRDEVRSSGERTRHVRYDSFGRTLPPMSVDDGIDLLFGGREFGVHGLGHYRARAYDPVGGRFIQEDAYFPYGYHYAFNNPLILRDPFGEDIIDEVGLLVATYIVISAIETIACYLRANETGLAGDPVDGILDAAACAFGEQYAIISGTYHYTRGAFQPIIDALNGRHQLDTF